jgi:hypothetical protein
VRGQAWGLELVIQLLGRQRKKGSQFKANLGKKKIVRPHLLTGLMPVIQAITGSTNVVQASPGLK